MSDHYPEPTIIEIAAGLLLFAALILLLWFVPG
jgi:hypothetical protein